MSTRTHPNCWQGDRYEHTCHRPSGYTCTTCGAPAGTLWGPYWCPDCDVTRIEQLSAGLEGLTYYGYRTPGLDDADDTTERTTS